MLILFFHFFSWLYCDCDELFTDTSDMTKTWCENNNTCETVLHPLHLPCECVYDNSNNGSECYESNKEARFCHEHINEFDCNNPQNFGHSCKWDRSNKCRAVCESISGLLSANCYGEIECFYKEETKECFTALGGCDNYNKDPSDAKRCNSQYGCTLISGECGSQSCEDTGMQVVDPVTNSGEKCKSNTQCDWHQTRECSVDNATEAAARAHCNEPTRRGLCVFDEVSKTCVLHLACRHRLWGHIPGLGTDQCRGFGEVECGEHVVCVYGDKGCEFKGDGSLVTKVGRRAAAAMMMVLLLFIVF